MRLPQRNEVVAEAVVEEPLSKMKKRRTTSAVSYSAKQSGNERQRSFQGGFLGGDPKAAELQGSHGPNQLVVEAPIESKRAVAITNVCVDAHSTTKKTKEEEYDEGEYFCCEVSGDEEVHYPDVAVKMEKEEYETNNKMDSSVSVELQSATVILNVCAGSHSTADSATETLNSTSKTTNSPYSYCWWQYVHNPSESWNVLPRFQESDTFY